MNTLYFYTELEIPELETLLKTHSEWLEGYLHDLYDSVEMDAEGERILKVLDRYSEELGLVEAHPVHQDICAEDFEFQGESDLEKEFFKSCTTTVFCQNIADFNLNPLQVRVIERLIEALPRTLVDDGSPDSILVPGQFFYDELKEKYKDISVLIEQETKRSVPKKNLVKFSDDPVSLKINLITKKLAQLDLNKREAVIHEIVQEKPQLKSLILALDSGESDGRVIHQHSKLDPKSYTDGLEKIMVILNRT